MGVWTCFRFGRSLTRSTPSKSFASDQESTSPEVAPASLLWDQSEVFLTLIGLSLALAPPGRQRTLGARDLEVLARCVEQPATTRDVPLAEQVLWRRLGQPPPDAATPLPPSKAPAFLWLPYDAQLPEGHVVLSFDDGPDPRATPRIRAVLAACGVRAHFFVPGSRLMGAGGAWAREEVLGLVSDGHIVGTHSFSHPSFSRRLLFRKQRRREIVRGVAALGRVLKAPIPLFRLPYGDGHEESAVHLAVWDEGLVNMHWNLSSGDTRDADPKTPGFQGVPPERLLKRILRSLDRSRRPGERLGHGVLTMHDTNYRTAEMLPQLLAHLVAEGYTFVRIAGPAIPAYVAEGPSASPPRSLDLGDVPAGPLAEVEEEP